MNSLHGDNNNEKCKVYAKKLYAHAAGIFIFYYIVF